LGTYISSEILSTILTVCCTEYPFEVKISFILFCFSSINEFLTC